MFAIHPEVIMMLVLNFTAIHLIVVEIFYS